jgi:hypothetical protein
MAATLEERALNVRVPAERAALRRDAEEHRARAEEHRERAKLDERGLADLERP